MSVFRDENIISTSGFLQTYTDVNIEILTKYAAKDIDQVKSLILECSVDLVVYLTYLIEGAYVYDYGTKGKHFGELYLLHS